MNFVALIRKVGSNLGVMRALYYLAVLLTLFMCEACTYLPTREIQDTGKATGLDSPYDQFPQMSCRLSDLKEKASFLRENNFQEAKQLNAVLVKRAKRDPFFSTLGSTCPYNYNRFGRENSALRLNASEVHFESKDFIMAGCPRTVVEVNGLMSCFLEKIEPNSQAVWVSLLASDEAPSRSNNFWKEEFLLSQLHLDEGWKIEKVDSKVLGAVEGDGLKIGPTLTERHLVFCNGHCTKTIIHFHYDGWYDRQPAPDERLFFLLIDKIEEASFHAPIVVNCIGGIGRSGETIVFYVVRKKIQDQLAKGVPLEEISVNLPETIYALRKQRPNALDNPCQISQLYEFLGDYYEQLRDRSGK